MPKLDLKEKVSPKHTALLVIDIQNDFASPNGKLAQKGRDLSQVEPMIDNLEKLINVAKHANVLTLYTMQIYDRNNLNELQKEQYDLDGKAITCDIDTDGYKFYRISPPESDTYVKYNFNAFSNRDLLTRLKENNIKTLVITGMDTIYCIETAIRNGYDLGYKIVVPKDLVAGNAKHQELNDKTLRLVEKSFGVLTTSEELINLWS